MHWSETAADRAVLGIVFIELLAEQRRLDGAKRSQAENDTEKDDG